uniref:EF-hand domain-containing protein n=1 Tax=Leersia perrieri TaxID=77586 RepID=A0A0D9XR60_9ORYZ
MGLCELSLKDGMFFLTIAGDGDGDGENYLTTEEFIAELEQKLKEIRGRCRPSSKGLVTIFAGSIRDGGGDGAVDYDTAAYRTAEAVRALFDMPIPTAAAVAGDVRSSLALSLVLAHDDMCVRDEAVFEVPDVLRDGRRLSHTYLLAALLRDKASYSYPMTVSGMVLQSKAMKGSDLSYWEWTECVGDSRESVTARATSIVGTSIGKVRDGKAYVATRKSFFPESWKAVSEFLGDKP